MMDRGVCVLLVDCCVMRPAAAGGGARSAAGGLGCWLGRWPAGCDRKEQEGSGKGPGGGGREPSVD